MSFYLFLPPFSAYHIISPPSCLAKLKQCFLWIKYTNAKDIPYPLGPKQVLNTFLQRISTRSAFAEKECLCDVSPMIIQGAWTRPMPGQPEENLLKSFSQTIYLQLCISIIHWNKYHVIVLPYTPTFCSWAWLKAIMPFSNRALTTKNYCHIYHSVSIIWRCYSISDGILS